MSSAPHLNIAPPLPVCPGCGAQRAIEDETCPRCAMPRPIAGWTTQPQVGEDMPGLQGFRMGAPLRPHGPVLRSRVAGPPARPGGPPLAAIALQVSEKALFPTMEARCRALQGVAHPAVPSVASIGVFHGRPTRIEQHLPGETVRALTWRRGPMAVEEVVSIVTEVAEGLAALHKAGIVHGRVCPDSVLLQASHGDRARRPLLVEVPAVPAGAWLGGVAPEVRLGDEPGPACDMFGLGYLLTTMLNGDDPGADGRDKKWAFIETGGVMELRERPDVPASLRRLTAALVQTDPQQRPARITDVVDTLRAAASGGPTESPRPTTAPAAAPQPEPAPVPRAAGLPRWWPAAALMAGVVLLFAGAGLLSTVTGVAGLFRPDSTTAGLASRPSPPATAPEAAAPVPPPGQPVPPPGQPAPPATQPTEPPADGPDPGPAPTASTATPTAPPTASREDRRGERSASAARSADAPPPAATAEAPVPAPAAEPAEATAPDAPDDPADADAPSVAEAAPDAPDAGAAASSAPPEPAASPTPEPAPEALSVAGRWTGEALGYPAVLDLRQDDSGQLRGSVTMRVGSRTVRYTVRGELGPSGQLQLSQSGGGSRATWSGDATAGSITGAVSPAPKDGSRFSFRR